MTHIANQTPRGPFDPRWVPNLAAPIGRPVLQQDNRHGGSDTVYDSGIGKFRGKKEQNALWDASARGQVLRFGSPFSTWTAVDYPGSQTGLVDFRNGDAYSFAVWVWLFDWSQINKTVFAKRRDGSIQYFCYLNNERITWRRTSGWQTGQLVVPIEEWAHLAVCIRSDGTGHMYVNGIQDPVSLNAASITHQPTAELVQASYHFGAGYDTGSVFRGQQEGLTAFREYLDQSQVQALYQSQYNGGPGILGTTRRWYPFPVAAPGGDLEGTTSFVFTVPNAELTQSEPLEGTVDFAFAAPDADLNIRASIAGTAVYSFTSIGDLSITGGAPLAGSTSFAFDFWDTTLHLRADVAGTTAFAFTAFGNLVSEGVAPLSGSADIAFSVPAAELFKSMDLNGTVSYAFTAFGNLTELGVAPLAGLSAFAFTVQPAALIERATLDGSTLFFFVVEEIPPELVTYCLPTIRVPELVRLLVDELVMMRAVGCFTTADLCYVSMPYSAAIASPVQPVPEGLAAISQIISGGIP